MSTQFVKNVYIPINSVYSSSYITFQFSTKTVQFQIIQSSIRFGLVCLFGFYGISTFVGHSTPNSVYIYIHINQRFQNEYLDR